jgi:ATP-dependent helicase/nuclease subunit A
MTGDRSESAVVTISRLHKKAGRTPVADLLKAFLDETDYRAALLQAGQARAARNVSKLLADAHASGIVGVGEFLAYIGQIGAGAAREGEARATAGNVVRIMSVHAAKGLEFPVVVLGDINYRGRGRNNLLLDPDFGVLLPFKDDDGAMPGIYRLGQDRHQDQEEAESERLLYVAATRAQDKLILNGAIKLSRNKRPGWLSGWLKQLAGPLNLTGQAVDYDGDGDRAIQLDLQVGQTPVGCTVYEPGYQVPFSHEQIETVSQQSGDLEPRMLAEVKPGKELEDEPTEEKQRDPPYRVWRVVPDKPTSRAPARLVGILVHEALALWRFPDGTLDYDRWMEARARNRGLVDPEQIRKAVDEAKELLDRFGKHYLYKEMDAAGRRLHEVPYSIKHYDDTVENGTIDVLYLREGVWTVVDFKTDRIWDESRFKKREDYEDQLRRYASAVERIIGQRPRAILCLLNYKGRIEWQEVSLS